MNPSKVFSSKRLQIDKANATMVMAMAISAFVFTFSLVAVKALWSQRSYQQRVIAKKEDARDQLKQNIEAAGKLVTQYQSFVSQSQNLIGGNPDGNGPRDGDNAKIILDALPSKYDFPAMATSMKNLFSTKGIRVTSLSGTDDELNQLNNVETNKPTPVDMPFTVSIEGNYSSVRNLFVSLERSIKPINIATVSITGADSKLTVNISAKTYYQPAKSLKISKVVVE